MIHLLVGIPGSGKSTYSKELKEILKCEVISTDNVRNMHPDWEEPLVWEHVYFLAAEALKNNIDVIFDATNPTVKVRRRFMDEVSKHNVTLNIGAYYFDTPWEECRDRVIKRNDMPGERFLPPEVVESYGKSITKPTFEEGFKFIKTIQYGKIVEELYHE